MVICLAVSICMVFRKEKLLHNTFIFIFMKYIQFKYFKTSSVVNNIIAFTRIELISSKIITRNEKQCKFFFNFVRRMYVKILFALK